jgi:hypothetical protein
MYLLIYYVFVYLFIFSLLCLSFYSCILISYERTTDVIEREAHAEQSDPT